MRPTILVLLATITAALLIRSVAEAAPLQSWDQVLERQSRFQVLRSFNNEAVLDRETQLVWEISPTGGINWVPAAEHCYTSVIGNRLGWRLPTIEELATLVDPSSVAQPTLPAGHPFDVPPTPPVWSATTDAGNAGFAWFLNFGDGTLDTVGKGAAIFAWCVRGGQGYDGQ